MNVEALVAVHFVVFQVGCQVYPCHAIVHYAVLGVNTANVKPGQPARGKSCGSDCRQPQMAASVM